ncbi:UPF0496 protein 1-like [Punica granatum]|uniref:UPF0496 protein 1-like n=2 Tax=Punica granatum TaxID=22663 RepID=A0A6P8D0U7_PUNGR|nr:UPF0496 protein 1-like [Punica granatum]XP_031388040.1 UPF0496 protein 1-like [Punica granatum]OWM66339.1 hypothetical protein CDL15_Pgr013556 [Punica granatum]PKI41593.1 hypothetical protein CRG98_037993 [Punica granatum]
MGGRCSKPRGGDDGSVTPNLADLAQYETACGADPRLTNFDTALHRTANRVISTLAVDVGRQSLSFTSLQEVTNSQLELNQHVVRLLLECQDDMWDDKDLSGLINDYFETSNQASRFCNVLDKCLARARDSQLILQFAVSHFEAEEEEEEEEKREKECEVGLEGTKYAKTLRELEKFKAAGDPFTADFFELLQSVSDRQFGLLKKLRDRKKKVEKKLKSSETWRRVSNALFVAAFVSALIFSVVAAAVAAPPVVTALAGVLTVPIGSVGKWVDSLWKKYQKELKGQKELLGLMGGSTRIAVLEVQTIQVLVDKFENKIESLMQNAEFAFGGDEALRLAVGEIKGGIEGFMKAVEDLREQSHTCSKDIGMARIILSQKLLSRSNGD